MSEADPNIDLPADTNDQLVLIGGKSGGGKSASMRNIRNQERWVHINTEAGKRLPFKNNFIPARIDDPYQVMEYMDEAIENKDQLDGVFVDSFTFMMDMLEIQYVLNSTNTQKAWGEFSQFPKTLLQQKVVQFGKPVIFTAHILDVLNEQEMRMNTAVPIKGSLKNNGIEAYFSTVVEATKVSLKDLEPYHNDMLIITEEDEMLGYKHVFQTRITKETVGKRIRSPMGLFTREQTYIDNDTQLLLDHLRDFYGN